MPKRNQFPITRNQRIAPHKFLLARHLRRNMTPEENLLWSRLRGSALEGLHFRRQQIVAGFIADFYCATGSLAIELDGPVHDDQVESDLKRDSAFAELGIRTLRIRNEEVWKDFEGVVQRIVAAARGPIP